MDVHGYSTTTYELKLYRRHIDWLLRTKQLYNRVAEHYLRILLNASEMLQESNHAILRELEIRTIGTKQMKEQGRLPEAPLDGFPSIPLYFRRAAINYAIGTAKSYRTRCEEWKRHPSGAPPGISGVCNAPPVYYKGMYREFQDCSIELKIFNGTAWRWIRFPFTGRKIPPEANCLSPTLFVTEKEAKLLVPVTVPVRNGGVWKERQAESRVFAIVFPFGEQLAVGAVYDREAGFLNGYFIRGGKELTARRTALERRLNDYGDKAYLTEMEGFDRPFGKTGKERRILQKIQNLNETYAHLVSRKIVNYSAGQGIHKIVVLEEAPGQHDTYEWLGRKILRYLKYKAFADGISVDTLSGGTITENCSICGAKLIRVQEGKHDNRAQENGNLFLCSNGHRGNYNLNIAKNIGKLFWSRQKKINR